MLVQLPRRSANADELATDPRIHLVALFLLFFSCSGNDWGDGVVTLDARDGGAHTTLPAAPEEQHFLAVSFSAADTLAGDDDYNANLEGTSSTSSKLALPSAPFAQTLQLRARKEAEERTRTLRAFRPGHGRTRQLTSPRAASPSTTISIRSPFQGDGGGTITGNLKGQVSDAALYVDSRYDSGLDTDELRAIVEDYGTISLPRLRVLFGDESDIDGDGRVILFLTAEEKLGEGLLGLFRPADLLPEESFGSSPSNGREIVYARLPAPDFPRELAHATLAHETFHLINFAQKSLPLYDATLGTVLRTEDTFLNEGMAHLAEDLTGWSTCTALLTKIYLECMPYASLAGSGSNIVPGAPSCETVGGSDSLPRRGGMMLFLLYAFQQMGGASYSDEEVNGIDGPALAFLHSLQTSAETGIENIEKSSARSFFDWYSLFAATLALDGSGQNDDPRFAFAKEENDSFTGMLRNIRMRGTRTDIDGSLITLTGPTIFQELTTGGDFSPSLFHTGAHVLGFTLPAETAGKTHLSGTKKLGLGMTIVRVD